jgi:hypothetical protein
VAAFDQLLVVVDPVARRADGESVRIAKDVLGAGATVKVCLPDGPEEFAKALVRRGSRRPVVIGDDRALLRAVALLHRERELAGSVLSFVPVGASLSLARSLGVPTDAVAAARAALEGVARRLDLLVDDSDGVVLGDLRIPPVAHPAALGSDPAHHWLRTCQSLVRTLAARPPRLSAPSPAGRGRERGPGRGGPGQRRGQAVLGGRGGGAPAGPRALGDGVGPGLPLPRGPGGGRPRTHPHVDGTGGCVGADTAGVT